MWSTDQSRRRKNFRCVAIYLQFFDAIAEKIGLFKCVFILFFNYTSLNWNSSTCNCDVVPSCFREIGRLINQAVISRVAIAAVGKSATRRQISRIILASVVNASNCGRRRGNSNQRRWHRPHWSPLTVESSMQLNAVDKSSSRDK